MENVKKPKNDDPNPVRCLIFSAIPKNFKIFSICQKTLVGRKNLI